MTIAVLMSTYNGETYIEEQINSILSQVCDGQISLWVRDDGSTDRTRDILQNYADKGMLQWYSGDNLKPAHSFMDLLNHCPGYDYYAFCDQDDYWYPNKLQTGIQALSKQNRPAMFFTNARLVDSQLNPLGRNVYNRQPALDFYSVVCSGGILGCTILFNKQLSQHIVHYGQPKKLIMHDYYCAIICTLMNGVILYDPNPSMDYRQHGSNVVGSQWKKRAAIKDRIDRICKKKSVTISQMAQSILLQNPQGVEAEKLVFLQEVAIYPKSLKNTLKLAFSRKLHFSSWNAAITVRLSILLKNC